MSITEQVQKVERDNTTLRVNLAKAEGTIQTYKEELGQERKKIVKLQAQVDDYKHDPLQAKVKGLQEKLRDANANKKVEKLKAKVQRLEEQLAKEQSLRMKSENRPEALKKNEELKAEVEKLKTENAVHHKCRTEADRKATEATTNFNDAMKLIEVYKDELVRLEVDTIQLVKSSGLKL